jgi:tRNA (guanine-N7-)-methyltransferase
MGPTETDRPNIINGTSMRQKKIKNVEEKIEAFSGPLVSDPLSLKERWREAFGGRVEGSPRCGMALADMPLYLEIGCGKGKFIKAGALNGPDALFLGFEGHKSVIYRALQRVHEDDGPGSGSCASAPDNLLLCAEYIMDMRDYFGEGELNGIFLNFSDPWPKTRQRTRRLTSPGDLDGYGPALTRRGFVRFKTDDRDFFEYSSECFRTHPEFEIIALTDDLHASEYAGDSEMTEYERRFLNLNRKIHYLEARRSVRSVEGLAYSHTEERRSMLLGDASGVSSNQNASDAALVLFRLGSGGGFGSPERTQKYVRKPKPSPGS